MVCNTIEFFVMHVDESGKPKETDEELGNVGWAHYHPQLQTMAAKIDCTGALILSAGSEELKVVPRHGRPMNGIIPARGGPVCGLDQGDDAADFLSKHFKLKCRLLWQPDEFNRKISDVKRFAACPHPSEAAIKANFYSSFSLSTSASLRHLWDACGVEIPERAFRHNLIIEGSELQPYSEDGWSVIRIGGLYLHYFKRVARCNVPKLDPDGNGMNNKKNEPLRHLQETRAGYQPCGKPGKFFGVNFNHVFSGETTIRVGDEVVVEEWRDPDQNYIGDVNPFNTKK